MKKAIAFVLISLALFVPYAMGSYEIDSIECADGSNESDCVVHVEVTCEDGTHGEANFFPWQTWGEMGEAFEEYCSDSPD